MKGLLKLALALGIDPSGLSLAALHAAINVVLGKLTTGNATQKADKRNKFEAAMAAAGLNVAVMADGSSKTYVAGGDIAAFLDLAQYTDETEYQTELALLPSTVKDTVASNYGVDTAGVLLAGFTRIENARKEARVHKMATLDQFLASQAKYTAQAQYVLNHISCRDQVADLKYQQIDMKGHLFTPDMPQGEAVALNSNTEYAKKFGFMPLSGFVALDSNNVPVLTAGQELSINIAVKRTEKEKSVFKSDNELVVAAVKRAGGFVDMESYKKPTVYLFDRTTSKQWSFDGIKGVTAKSTAIVNAKLQLRVAEKTADFGMNLKNMQAIKDEAEVLMVANPELTQLEAIKIAKELLS